MWNGNVKKEQTISNQIALHLKEFIDPNASEEDLLYEILLKTGFPLTTKIIKLNLADKTVYSTENNKLLICLEKNITKDLIKEIVLLKPKQVVLLDRGFSDNDQLKTNAKETFESHGITNFKTI